MASTEEPAALSKPVTGGRRVRRPARRRAPKLRGALLITGLSALAPGSGYLYSGRRILGGAVLAVSAVFAVAAVRFVPRDIHSAVDFAADPTKLKTFTVTIIVGLAAWTAVVVTTFLMVRP